MEPIAPKTPKKTKESRTVFVLVGLFGLMAVCGLPGLQGLFAQGGSGHAGGQLVPWSLHFVGYAFFAGISAGAFFVATLPHVFGARQLAPLGRLSLFVALVALLAAFMFVVASRGVGGSAFDVGGHAGPGEASPWSFAFAAAHFAVVLSMLGVSLRPEWARSAAAGRRAYRLLAMGYEASPARTARDARILKVLGIVGLVAAARFPAGLGTGSTGILPLSFLLLSGTSGAALVLAVALLLLRGGEAYRDAVRFLGRIVGVLLAIQAVVVIVETFLAIRGTAPEQAEVLRTMAFGRSGWLFWGVQIVAGSAVPLLVLFRKQPSLRAIAISSLLVIAGVFTFRMNLAVPRLEDVLGSAGGAGVALQGQLAWVNFLLFCIGLGGCLFALGYRLLPLVGRDVALEFQAAGGEAARSGALAYAAALPAALPGWQLPAPPVVPHRPEPARAPAVETPPTHVETDQESTETAIPGAFGKRWWVAFGVASIGLAFGAFSFVYQDVHGEVVTGMRTTGGGGAGWGLYVAFLTYFIGVSFAGTAVAAVTHLFRIRAIRPLGRMAELISILALALAAVCILADQGRPIHALLNLPRYTKVMSPFFGTFVLMGTYLFANLVFLFLDGRADAAAMAARGGRLRRFYALWASGWTGSAPEVRRHDRTCFWLAIATLAMLVAEQSTIGLIFGTQVGRPGWFSALQAPEFLVLAGVSGLGLLVVVAAAVRRFLGLERTVGLDTFRWLGGALLVMTAAHLYLVATESFTSLYASVESDGALAREIVFGPYAGLFWTAVASLLVAFAILFAQFVTRRTSVRWAVIAGLLVNVGVILKRYLIVVPSQTRGVLVPLEEGEYAPTWVEYGIVLGAVALAVCVYLVFVRVFPVVHGTGHEGAEASGVEPQTGRLRRFAFFGLTLAAGTGLAIVALLSAARVGREHYLDPAIPNSPVLFILGIMTMLLSAVVYETLHSRKGRKG